jgi:hypothetical protein
VSFSLLTQRSPGEWNCGNNGTKSAFADCDQASLGRGRHWHDWRMEFASNNSTKSLRDCGHASLAQAARAHPSR